MTPADPKRVGEGQTAIPDFVIESMARCLLPEVQAYFASPEGQAEFEKWKRQQENTYQKRPPSSDRGCFPMR